MTHCKYASCADESWERSPISGRWVPKKDVKRDMCTWALYHPDAVDKLTNVPPWLSRNALAGHLMRPADCESCPLFEEGDPVE